jgi:hypothetical protein
VKHKGLKDGMGAFRESHQIQTERILTAEVERQADLAKLQPVKPATAEEEK